jgi:hypothetical protein
VDETANAILMLGMLWGGLTVCALGAFAFDVALWLGY